MKQALTGEQWEVGGGWLTSYAVQLSVQTSDCTAQEASQIGLLCGAVTSNSTFQLTLDHCELVHRVQPWHLTTNPGTGILYRNHNTVNITTQPYRH